MNYPEVVAELRDFATQILPITVDRISWDAFGAPGLDGEVDPSPLNPADGIWARPVLVGEATLPGGGWGWVEKTGVLILELRCEGAFDQDDSGLATLAGEVESALNYAEIGEIEFAEARSNSVESQEARRQINVVSVYRRVEIVGETLTQEETPVNYILPGHSFVSLQLLRPVGDGSWELAQDDSVEQPAQAVVRSVAGDRVSLLFGGSLRLNHGLGASGPLYLSQTTPGGMTTTEPASGIRQRVGTIVSDEELLIAFDPPEQL